MIQASNQHFLGFKTESKLHLVEIYFDTPTFDKITKAKKANFVMKLSTIGGTLGLLTGFSIISGVEILYLAAKVVVNALKKKSFNNNKTSKL